MVIKKATNTSWLRSKYMDYAIELVTLNTLEAAVNRLQRALRGLADECITELRARQVSILAVQRHVTAILCPEH